MLTPFIAHGILKMKERGLYDAHSKRHIKSEPNCKPLNEEGQSLGMEKFAQLFVYYAGCLALSLIIFVMENIFIPSSVSLWKNQDNQRKLKAVKKYNFFTLEIISLFKKNIGRNQFISGEFTA